ncbi:MAG: PDZ domain-containing protein [Negativicutes bacterium]|nr:PDZ domain-containing protein [Negativicutes bacterium]
MFPWQEFFQLIFQGTIQVYLQAMFWLILGIVAFQYWRMQRDQVKMFGVYGYSLWRQVLLAALYGTVGGMLASLLLALTGVTLNQVGLGYIWPVAILLMAINLRFMCFAYAGGLVAASCAIFGWPEVNVPQVLALVAILHITESILIYISGRQSDVPLILRRDDSRLVGAFNLQNFWPLPLVLLAAVTVPEASLPAGSINMPDWWPLLPIAEIPPEGQTWLYGMIPVVAALGYADIAVSSSPAARRRRSALHLALYSGVLLTLALLSAHYQWLQLFAALLSPLGHEFLIQMDNRREMRGTPRFIPPDHGVMVLETLEKSPARMLGLKPGDILLELDGMKVDDGFSLAQAISLLSQEFAVSYSREGQLLAGSGRFIGGERRLGLILVPEGYERHYAEIPRERYGLLDWLKRRWKR